MLHLSITARQALAKLTLPVLVAAAFGLMLLGKADTVMAEHARIALDDALAPIYAVLSQPLGRVHDAVANTVSLWNIRDENERLLDENRQLRRWQTIALALDAENKRLKDELHWIPDHAPGFVTARVVADAGGVYAKAVLLSVGPHHSVHQGAIALDGRGLVGRVTEVGSRVARVLLITDLNSRVPVIMERTGAHAILVGTNGPRPRLLYWPEDSPPVEGEAIVTSPVANAFPADLPVGFVHYDSAHVPEVVPAAALEHLEAVRLFDYKLTGSGQAPTRPPSVETAY